MGNFAENLNLGNRFRPPLDRILRRRPSYAQTAPFLYAVLLGTTELQLDQNV